MCRSVVNSWWNLTLYVIWIKSNNNASDLSSKSQEVYCRFRFLNQAARKGVINQYVPRNEEIIEAYQFTNISFQFHLSLISLSNEVSVMKSIVKWNPSVPSMRHPCYFFQSKSIRTRAMNSSYSCLPPFQRILFTQFSTISSFSTFAGVSVIGFSSTWISSTSFYSLKGRIFMSIFLWQGAWVDKEFSAAKFLYKWCVG